MGGAELTLEGRLLSDHLTERGHDDALDDTGQNEVRVHHSGTLKKESETQKSDIAVPASRCSG